MLLHETLSNYSIKVEHVTKKNPLVSCMWLFISFMGFSLLTEPSPTSFELILSISLMVLGSLLMGVHFSALHNSGISVLKAVRSCSDVPAVSMNVRFCAYKDQLIRVPATFSDVEVDVIQVMPQQLNVGTLWATYPLDWCEFQRAVDPHTDDVSIIARCSQRFDNNALYCRTKIPANVNFEAACKLLRQTRDFDIYKVAEVTPDCITLTAVPLKTAMAQINWKQELTEIAF